MSYFQFSLSWQPLTNKCQLQDVCSEKHKDSLSKHSAAAKAHKKHARTAKKQYAYLSFERDCYAAVPIRTVGGPKKTGKLPKIDICCKKNTRTVLKISLQLEKHTTKIQRQQKPTLTFVSSNKNC